jgi:hypothetical protein
MEMLWLGVGLGAGAASLLWLVAAVARAGTFNNVALGLTVAGQARIDPPFAAKLNALLAGVPVPVDASPALPASPPPPALPPTAGKSPVVPASLPAQPKASGEAVRLLALLQSDARLVDFLMEDIAGAPDATIGQAVKDIHKKAAKVLKDHVVLSFVMAGADGDRVTVAPGFDPAAVRVVGNVTGAPPFTGTLLHPGWRVKEVRLPELPAGQDPYILQPAEVELA